MAIFYCCNFLYCSFGLASVLLIAAHVVEYVSSLVRVAFLVLKKTPIKMYLHLHEAILYLEVIIMCCQHSITS